MIIYIIPSWYPSKKYPLSGSFIQEQIQSLARNHPELIIVVGLRSDFDIELSFKNPLKIIFLLIKQFINSRDKVKRTDNLFEISNPSFSLRNFPNLFSANKRHFALHKWNIRYCQKYIGKIDIIHAHVADSAGVIALEINKRFKIPYILTEHRFESIKKIIKSKGQKYKQLLKILFHAEEVICVSQKQAYLLKFISPKMPLIIPNLTDEEKFFIKRDKPRSKYFTFATLCGLIKNKGLETLLEAIAIWKPFNLNVHFKIGGAGYHESFLKSMAYKLGISELITWTGFIDRENVPEFFQESEIFVLPSQSESFGIVYIEALACGLPVIATRCGGPEEIVNKENGVLIDIDNPKQLAEALQFSFENYDKFNLKIIREDFEKRFSSKVVTAKLLEIYSKITNKFINP